MIFSTPAAQAIHSHIARSPRFFHEMLRDASMGLPEMFLFLESRPLHSLPAVAMFSTLSCISLTLLLVSSGRS